MIVVDTNVLSEEMRPVPAAPVLAWFGVAMLPDGRRKLQLETAARDILELFAGRILPFDSAAAAAYAEIVATRRQIGRPINDFDAQIAAIARSRDMALATRD